MVSAPTQLRLGSDWVVGDGLVGGGLVGDGLVGDGLVGGGLVGDGLVGDGWFQLRLSSNSAPTQLQLGGRWWVGRWWVGRLHVVSAPTQLRLSSDSAPTGRVGELCLDSA